MTKIKNFRITLRPREIARWLKKERGLATTPELEMAIEQVVKESKKWIEPAAVYATLTRQVAQKTTPIIFPDKKSIAVSIAAVSIGTRLRDERAASEADPVREPLLAALEQEALAQTVHFAVRLIQDQGKEEDCEMSGPVSAELLPPGQEALSVVEQETSISASLAALVGIQRIGVDLDSTSHELPPHARVAWLFWTPVGKGTAKRAEKVAA